jgi:hypothetical protein
MTTAPEMPTAQELAFWSAYLAAQRLLAECQEFCRDWQDAHSGVTK